MITIGRPRNISHTKDYGNFDIAHLVVYFRSITKLEMSVFPTEPLETGTATDLECCAAKQSMGLYVIYLIYLH